jgi:glutathione synthase/RimK-type ligase-like ATP-grasp enzyme
VTSRKQPGRPTVLIVGAAEDPQVRRVASAIRAQDGRALLCDTQAFPERARISLRDGDVLMAGRKLPQPGAVYVRGLGANPLMPEFDDDLKSRPRGLMAQMDEKQALLTSMLLILEQRGARLVNGLEANGQHSRKPYQLHLLRRAGLPVPRYLATNDPQAVRRFVRTVKNAVYKPLAGGATVQRVKQEDLTDERLSALALAPVLFQELVAGTSVRVYVVGRRVVAAAEIQSSELDYRRAEGAVVPARLSPDERRAAVVAARACGMAFSGVDLIRRAGGFVVLECNPSPMFAVFEQKTGLDVAGPLAELLAGTRR